MKTIYCIKCSSNNRVYIGCTYNLDKRKKEHLNELKRNKHYNKSLQDDFNKFGISEFSIFAVEQVSDELSTIKEDYWINYLGGINCENVYNNMTSKTKSEHMKKQLGDHYRGKTHEETYGVARARKMKLLNSEKHKGKLSSYIPNKGKVKTLSGEMIVVTEEIYNKVKSLRSEGNTYKQISILTNIKEDGVRNIVVDNIHLFWKCND